MHFTTTDIILTVATALFGWIASRVKTPADHQRAELIERIAAGAAAIIVSLYPKADWATLLKQVVDRMALSNTTSNRSVLEAAAAKALTDLGKNPNATP